MSLTHGGQALPRDFDVLREIVDLLPVALTVRDEDGRCIFVNDAAAAATGRHAATLIGTSPEEVLPAAEADRRRHEVAGLLRAGTPAVCEETVSGRAGDCTLLTWHQPARIGGRTVLMSTSLDITDRKAAEDELARRAYFDELTGLPNRALIQERVEDVLRRDGREARFALAFLDLDNFKHINDYYNHTIGDALLVKVAERIAGRLRASDMLARISGDEFVLLVDPVESEEELRAAVSRLLEDLKQPFHIEGFEVFTSASVGMSVHPDHGHDYESLRRNADSAMYRAKRAAKGGVALFDRDIEQAVLARMELEQRLRLAIRDRRFRCAFQPKVDIRSQEVVGFEALIRWCDDRGVIQAPGDFIGLAIELGLIDAITHFVLGEAVDALEELDAAYGAGTTVSVNVAAKQANDLQFMRSLTASLERSRCAHRFILELTEEAFVAKTQFQTRVLPMLREIGVRVSIDDFGTGYSSLSALADIWADEIKVDRSFVTAIHQRPRSQSVLKAIESISHALGMTVIAEGVETYEELAYLQAATRIRYAQGFYFAKPFFLEDFGHARQTVGTRVVQSARERPERRGSGSSRGTAEQPWRRG